MPWTKRFDPTGKDSVWIPKKYTERVEDFLKEAEVEVKDGLKYATTRTLPHVGECWVFPATVIVGPDVDSQSN